MCLPQPSLWAVLPYRRDMPVFPRVRVIPLHKGRDVRNCKVVPGSRRGCPDLGKSGKPVPTIRREVLRVIHMTIPIILASGSDIRAQLLRNAGVPFRVERPRVDEAGLKSALLAESAPPRDIADALAEAKARKVAARHPGAMVIGCDQVLDFEGRMLSRPDSPDTALAQLAGMRGQRHMLLSAAVICHRNEPVWRHVGQVRMRMRDLSDDYLAGYVRRNWNSIRHAVGGYKLEEEGVRLFSAVDGDYFHVLGMPLIEILSFLMLRGVIDR